MKKQEHYTFGNSGELTERLVILTGVARSGTTILGKLLASLKGLEFEYEPWFLAQLPIIEKAGLIDPAMASELLQGYTHELFNSHLLGRGVNVRSTDDSRVSIEDLKTKWETLKSREDAKQYAKKNQSLLAMKMVNLQPFYGFLYRTFPKLKVIHIVRNGFDAALSIQKKRWFSDAALNHAESVSMKKEVTDTRGEKRMLPWWVDSKDIEKFIQYSEFSRGLCCWRTLMEKDKEFQKPENFLEIRYEALIQNPLSIARQICRFLETDFGLRTESMLKTVDRDKPVGKQEYPLADAEESEIRNVCRLMKEKGYELPNVYAKSF